MHYPPTINRIKAFLIDLVLVLIIFSITAYVIDLNQGAPAWVRIIVLVGMLYLYEPLMISLTGGTVGHHLLKIRVGKASDPSQKIGLLLASLRIILKIVLGTASIFVSYMQEDRKTLHDIICGTNVYYKKDVVSDQSA